MNYDQWSAAVRVKILTTETVVEQVRDLVVAFVPLTIKRSEKKFGKL